MECDARPYTRLGQPTLETLHVAGPQASDRQKEDEYDQQLRMFIRRWYHGKRRKPTEDELDQIVVSARRQIENSPEHCISWLDVSIPTN